MTSETWSGTLHLARDFALLHGRAGTTAAHAHYAHQLLLSDDAPIEIAIDGRRLAGTRLLIRSQQAHAIVSAPAALHVIYAEPLRLDAATLDAIAPPPDSAALLGTLQALPRRAPVDARIDDALAEIDAMLSGKVDAGALAGRVRLSLSQLERLFSAQVGLSVRRLVRWRRLRLALQLALTGRALTVAAHDAGFADSAHFSRVMRELFGVRADRTLAGLHVEFVS
ncbi:helix-turn-helix domain-containing protein [Solimonas flava]|uniref:helix-turn-helix domain-containing protein n=1 Tax=Solimonas flava TaxID=415849 RepID=UPI000426AC4A|nr:AraC family transcriptional regulator [Solimonas flava]